MTVAVTVERTRSAAPPPSKWGMRHRRWRSSPVHILIRRCGPRANADSPEPAAAPPTIGRDTADYTYCAMAPD
jgi:hypothetical protein